MPTQPKRAARSPLTRARTHSHTHTSRSHARTHARTHAHTALRIGGQVREKMSERFAGELIEEMKAGPFRELCVEGT